MRAIFLRWSPTEEAAELGPDDCARAGMAWPAAIAAATALDSPLTRRNLRLEMPRDLKSPPTASLGWDWQMPLPDFFFIALVSPCRDNEPMWGCAVKSRSMQS